MRKKDDRLTDLFERRSNENIHFNQYVNRDASTDALFVYQSGVKHTTSSGWVTKPRMYDHYIIHFITDGAGTFMPDSGDYPVRQGDAFLIRPYCTVTYRADTVNPYSYYWIGFNGTEAEKLMTQCGFTQASPVLHDVMTPDTLGVVKKLIETKLSSASQEYVLLSYLYMIFASLIEQRSSEAVCTYKDYCYTATCYIRQNLGSSRLTVQSVADHIGIDRSHLYRVFETTLHQSVRDFILSARIQKAKVLLSHDSDCISNIAYSCGFSDASHFTAMFKRKVGISPLRYRNANTIDAQ